MPEDRRDNTQTRAAWKQKTLKFGLLPSGYSEETDGLGDEKDMNQHGMEEVAKCAKLEPK